MRAILAIASIVLSVLGAFGLIASNLVGMIPNQEVPAIWQFLGLALFLAGVIISLITTQVERIIAPKIILGNWGIEHDKKMFYRYKSRFLVFWDVSKTLERTFKAAYIEVYIKPILGRLGVERLLADISWFNTDGMVLRERNNGRWWVSNVASYNDTTKLQAVDLEANGLPRRLYFARVLNGELFVWHRTQDNKEPLIFLDPGEYLVQIDLNSNNGAHKTYWFRVLFSGSHFELEKVKRWKKIKIRERVLIKTGARTKKRR